MKLNGIFGTGSGKTGNAVFATSAGKQIVRTYQPKVTNPNTDAQVEQRAKFKLLSQLAAAMAPVIVIPKEGLVSSRNRFVKMNMPYVAYNNDAATITLINVYLTASQKAIPSFDVVAGSAAGTIECNFDSSLVGICEKVRYSVFMKTENEKLQLVAQKVVEVNTSTSQTATTTFSGLAAGEYVVYAYGMTEKRSTANAGYSDYSTPSDDDMASLYTSMRISAYNYDFTLTRGVEHTVE